MTPLTSRSGINTTDEEQICGCKELGIWERGECDYKGVTQGSLVLVQPFCVLIVVVAIQVFTCDIIPYTCTHRHTHTHTGACTAGETKIHCGLYSINFLALLWYYTYNVHIRGAQAKGTHLLMYLFAISCGYNYF
jgi:hypothetical protein